MSGPNSVRIEESSCLIGVASMVYKHWSESDPEKLQNRINEENEQFRRDIDPLLKEVRMDVERVIADWRNNYPGVNTVAWSSAKDFTEWDEMMADEGSFPEDNPFILSMGFRLNRHTLSISVSIGFKEKPAIASYKVLKKNLNALFAEIDEKSWSGSGNINLP